VVWVFTAVLGYFEQLRHQCHVPDALFTYRVAVVAIVTVLLPGVLLAPLRQRAAEHTS
jgi:hypothetical protein